MLQATTTTILLASLGLTAIFLSFILFRSYRMGRFIKCASFYVMRDVIDSLEKAEEHVSKANVIRLQHKFEDRVKAAKPWVNVLRLSRVDYNQGKGILAETFGNAFDLSGYSPSFDALYVSRKETKVWSDEGDASTKLDYASQKILLERALAKYQKEFTRSGQEEK